jgi:hypothetical protein
VEVNRQQIRAEECRIEACDNEWEQRIGRACHDGE